MSTTILTQEKLRYCIRMPAVLAADLSIPPAMLLGTQDGRIPSKAKMLSYVKGIFDVHSMLDTQATPCSMLRAIVKWVDLLYFKRKTIDHA